MSETFHRALIAGALAIGLQACGASQKLADPVSDVAAIEHAAHGGYVDAINTNDPEKLAAVLAEDVVYQYPGAPELVGKPAVLAWVRDYFGAYATRWEKTSIGFTISGEWAFERYTYKSTDTDRKTGAVVTDTGKGTNVFHHDADGKWRVAIDGWSSDTPPDPAG